MDDLVILTPQLNFYQSAVDLVVVVKSPVGLLIVGVVTIAAGLLSIVFRRAIRDTVVRAQTRSFGAAIGKKMEATRPWAFAVVGAIAICMGSFCLVLLFI